MKVKKKQIKLSELHPSLLLELPRQSVLAAPCVIDQEGTLVDGYRRFQLQEDDEIEAIKMKVDSIFPAALEMNRRTRSWDEVDCFLWSRWARSIGIPDPPLPHSRFPEPLFGADTSLLKLLANRKLLLRQVVLILQAPARYRAFFQDTLSATIQLNANETAIFLEMACDLTRILGLNQVHEIFAHEGLARILGSEALSPKQKGEGLLKEMRVLRYPNYQRKSEEFSSCWQQLNLEKGIQARKSSFLERGVLEISFSALSFDEMKQKVEALYQSMNSPEWKKIWEV